MKIVAYGLLLSFALVAQAQQPDSQGWIALIHGQDTKGWKLRHGPQNGWSVKDGVLTNQLPSTDLIGDVPMGDFELHVEFLIPKGSNSGIYLQSRYEVQIMDSAGFVPSNIVCGAIYGLLSPKQNAAKSAGEWQSMDITFHQYVAAAAPEPARTARVTVILNGQKVIDNADVDRPTQGAVGNDQGVPAGLILQGDHGRVSFRNLKFRPLK